MSQNGWSMPAESEKISYSKDIDMRMKSELSRVSDANQRVNSECLQYVDLRKINVEPPNDFDKRTFSMNTSIPKDIDLRNKLEHSPQYTMKVIVKDVNLRIKPSKDISKSLHLLKSNTIQDIYL